MKIALRNRPEKRLYITDGQNPLVIINKDQQKYMLLGILLPYRRGQQIVFGIIIDHCLGQYFVLSGIPRRGMQSAVHKCRDLIHVQINVRNVLRADILHSVQTFQYTVQ